jgi:hypothetical protein
MPLRGSPGVTAREQVASSGRRGAAPSHSRPLLCATSPSPRRVGGRAVSRRHSRHSCIGATARAISSARSLARSAAFEPRFHSPASPRAAARFVLSPASMPMQRSSEAVVATSRLRRRRVVGDGDVMGLGPSIATVVAEGLLRRHKALPPGSSTMQRARASSKRSRSSPSITRAARSRASSKSGRARSFWLRPGTRGAGAAND